MGCICDGGEEDDGNGDKVVELPSSSSKKSDVVNVGITVEMLLPVGEGDVGMSGESPVEASSTTSAGAGIAMASSIQNL